MRFQVRFQARLLFGLAVLLGGIAGCSSSRHGGSIPGLDQSLAEASTQPTTFPSDYDHPQRLGQSGDPFRVSHPRIDHYVDRFQTDLRGFFSGALLRSGKYVPRMMSILEKEGVPTELVYLPLIESGYRTRAVSPAGAVGPWQFIPGTGRRYGLRIDRYVDERCDPVKSTRAAARYLRDLHDMFGDWHLSLAAYNTGEGRISRILESGLAADYWEMSDNGYLFRETEEYVPEFLAAVQIAEHPEAHGFETPEMETLEYDIVSLKSSIQLTTIARLAGAPVDEIKDLNPALHRGMVPPEGYSVRLPKGSKNSFQLALLVYEDEMRELNARRALEARSRAAACHGKGKRCNAPSKSVGVATPMLASAAQHPAKRGAVAKHVVATKQIAVKKAAAPVVASAHKGKPAKMVTAKKAPARAAAKAVASRKPMPSTRAAGKIAAKRPAPIVTASHKNVRRVVD